MIRFQLLGALKLSLLAIFAVAIAQALQYQILAEHMPEALALVRERGMSAQLFVAFNTAGAAILIVPASLVGVFTAHRMGLVSLIAYRVTEARQRMKLLPAYALAGLGLGAAIALFDRVLFSALPALAQLAAADPDAVYGEVKSMLATLGFRMLWGGIYEEVLMRWGLVSLIAWGFVSIIPSRKLSVSLAVLIIGLLSGALHLPATYGLITDPPVAMIIRVVALNALIGISIGAAYVRNSLEAAMVMHAAAHIGLLLSPTTQV